MTTNKQKERDLLKTSIDLIKEQDWQGVISLLTDKTIAEIKDSNKRADAYLYRGVAYFTKDEYEKVIKDLKQAIGIYEEEIKDNLEKASELKLKLSVTYYLKEEAIRLLIIKDYFSFAQNINKIQSELKYKGTKSLYHYSSKEAIDGIVCADDRNGYFAFTEANFLNDPTEGNFLLDIIDNNQLKIKKDAKKPFVACFSTLDDDLNQWRLYGDDGNGANIGIEANEYLKAINEDMQEKNKDNINVYQQIETLSWSHICYVNKENYKFYKTGRLDSEIPKLLNNLSDCVKNILKNTTPDKVLQNIEDKDIKEEIEQRLKGIDFEDYVKEVVTEKLDTISCLFKHIAYKDEKEVRLVVPFCIIPNDDLNLDGYKVKWQAPAIPFNAIKSIKFGPNQNQDFKTYLFYKKEQAQYCEDEDCKDIDISHSALPYKSKKQ